MLPSVCHCFILGHLVLCMSSTKCLVCLCKSPTPSVVSSLRKCPCGPQSETDTRRILRYSLLAAVHLQIVQSMSFYFWKKKRVSVWLSENTWHLWAKLIITIHIFCSEFPKRKKCLILVHVTYVWFGERRKEGAGGHYLWFQATLLTCVTSWNYTTPERALLCATLWIWKVLRWIFYDLLVKASPYNMT